MNEPSSVDHDRLLELAVDRALFGLDTSEQAEFEALRKRYADVDVEDVERVAALLELGGSVAVVDMPRELRHRVLEDADAHRSSVRPPVTLPSQQGRGPGTSSWMLYSGWLAAAACLLVAVLAGWDELVMPPSLASQRQQLVDTSRHIVRAEWTATDDPASAGATGDVVWSSDAQQGFMRFRGLAPNDPSDHQYQLWIVDGDRSDPEPVDGGVFDIPAGGDEVIIPVHAALSVGTAIQFVITVEEPGGVVVSRQERVPLVAKVT